jgi:VWFA-related protein
MPNQTHSLSSFSLAALLCLAAFFSTTSAQQPQPQQQPAPSQTPQQQPDDVIRINTELIQTDVTVLDKQGRFVDNLRREQFELLIDGKPQPITFFEKVRAGSTSEEMLVAAARGQTEKVGNIRPPDRGRTIFFFIDDMHMALDSLTRARKTLLRFVDAEMGQNDQVAIISANGQVGFLQQLTDNKTVLRAAIARLKSSTQATDDRDQPPMSEPMAQAIEVYNDADVIKFYVEPLLTLGIQFQPAENIVRNRARRVLAESYNLTRVTLATLENLARSSGTLPGRKLVFFISDGFMLNPNLSDMQDRIRNITNVSAKNGVVIYSLDGRGLVAGGFSDASNNLMGSNDGRGEMTGVVSRYLTKNLTAMQEPLRIIAANTGGKAFVNSNSLNVGFGKAISETSVYYLVAWRPETGTPQKEKFRQVEVRIAGRPDLNVQVRRGYYDVAPPPPTVARTETVKAPPAPAKGAKAKTAAELELREAIASPYPTNALPTQLGLVYMDTPDKGVVLTASIQIARQFMTFSHSEDKQTALLDLTGVVLDDNGKPVSSFRDRLDVAVYFPKYVGPPRRDLIYNFQSPLKPGLYQVRVATRDSKSGRTGSAIQWIEIPDLASRKLSLSSLLLGETTKDAELLKSGDPTAIAESMLTVDRRLPRSSKLRLMTYVYNAARGANGTGTPDVTIQLQVLRNDQPIVTTSSRRIEAASAKDPARLPYAAEMPLEGLLPGRYVLQITAIDRISKSTASQRASFEIE